MSEGFCLPCPICGGRALINYRPGLGYAVICLDGTQMTTAYHYLGSLHAETEDEAVQRWNALCEWFELRYRKEEG